MAGTTAPKADVTSRSISTTKTQPKAKPKARAKKKAVMYVSKNITMYNPIAMVRFYPGSPIKCAMDDWLKAQIKVGLIKEA